MFRTDRDWISAGQDLDDIIRYLQLAMRVT